MDDLFDYSADVTVAFCIVEITQTGGLFVVMGVRFELANKLLMNGLFSKGEKHTMACERLCVLMTRPILCSTSKEISPGI